jgi:hypothetical protein
MKSGPKTLLSAVIAASFSLPVYAQDGFSGTYQSAQPQQWQPLAPQQGYAPMQQQQQSYGQQPQGGFPAQQGGYPAQQGGYPPQQGGYPPQQAGYPPQQAGYPPQQGGYPPQQGGNPPGLYQGGAQPPGQMSTFYGYASEAGQQQQAGASTQAMPPMQGPYSGGGGTPQGAFYQQPAMQQGMPPPQQGMPPMQQGMPPMQGQTQADDTANDVQEEPEHTDKFAGVKKAGKIVAGVGAGVAGVYLLNKAMNRMNPMYGNSGYGGYPPPGYGYGGYPPQGYGYGGYPPPPYGGMPYGGYPSTGNPLLNMFLHH